MSRDYANRKQKTKTYRSKHDASGLRWTMTIVIILLFIIGLSYLKTHEQKTKHHHLLTAKNEHKTNSKKQPEYDFYTLLPKMKVVVGDENNVKQTESQTIPAKPFAKTYKQAAKPTQAIQNQQKKSIQYLIQIAAFKHYQDADKLKAELSLQGYHVKMLTTANHKLILHRVFVGPFSTQQMALNVQNQLTKMHLTAFIVKVQA